MIQNVLDSSFGLAVDYRLIAGIFLTLLLPVVLYKGDCVYTVKDAFYLLGGVFFLGCSMTLFSLYRNKSLELLVFLFLITIITDSYALFVGKLIGKNKLLKEISPNKRAYSVKDFSNIMPGHGGVLDRLDSIIFVMLAFTFFIELI